jgi:hypothetical protein
LIDSIHKMLRYDPAARITAKDLLAHEFFQETARRFGPNIAVNLPPGQDPYGPPVPSPSPREARVAPGGAANRSVSTLDLQLQRPASDLSDRSIPPSHSIPRDHQPVPPFAQPPVAVASHSRTVAASPLGIPPAQTNGNPAASPNPSADARFNAMPPTLVPRPLDGQSIRSMPESLYNGSQLNGRHGLDARSHNGAPLQRVSTYAPSVAPSTYYDGSVFEGAGPGRASSVLSFPLQYSGMDAMPPIAGPSGFNTYRSQSPAPSSIYSQPGLPSHAALSNPLKRAPSDASLSSMRVSTPPGTYKSEEYNAASERDAFILTQEDIGGGTAKERARAVLLKKTSLRNAADPLNNFARKNGDEGSDGASIFSHSGRSTSKDAKGKGRAAPSERMPQIIEDTSRLQVSSPPNERSAATSSGGFNRHKTRRRDGNDDVHSILSVESGRSAPAWGFSIPGGKGRTFSISSKATSASDPERRQNASSDFLGPNEQPARLQSVSSLPIPGARRAPMASGSMQRLPSLGQYTAPSTGHSSLDAALIGRMQGLASSSQQDLTWQNEATRSGNDSASPRLDRSGSRSRVASPSESRFNPYSASRGQPLPTLPPIQSFDLPPTSQHPILQRQGTGTASLASFRSTPGVMPSYFAAPDRAPSQSRDAGSAAVSATTYHLPYIPAMDVDPAPPPPPMPLSAGLAGSFPFHPAPSLAAITEPPAQPLTPEHLPPG